MVVDDDDDDDEHCILFRIRSTASRRRLNNAAISAWERVVVREDARAEAPLIMVAATGHKYSVSSWIVGSTHWNGLLFCLVFFDFLVMPFWLNVIMLELKSAMSVVWRIVYGFFAQNWNFGILCGWTRKRSKVCWFPKLWDLFCCLFLIYIHWSKTQAWMKRSRVRLKRECNGWGILHAICMQFCMQCTSSEERGDPWWGRFQVHEPLRVNRTAGREKNIRAGIWHPRTLSASVDMERC